MDTRTYYKYIVLILIVFLAACIETDIYLPALADMMTHFEVSEEAIQQLLTWNFVGVCLAGPFYGPLSDSIGRKKPIMAALALFLVGSIMTLFAESFEVMLWGRVLQGLGSGGCFTLGTAIIFDAFQGEKAIKAINQLNSIVPFIMAAAPMFGGFLNNAFGFRSNFLAIGIFVLVSFVICLFFLEETLPKEKRAPFKAKKLVADFKRVFSSAPFWQVTLIVCLIFSGYLAFLSSTALLFVVEFGVSKTLFPFFQAALLGAWLAGSLTVNRAISRWSTQRVKMIGTGLITAGAIGLVVACFVAPEDPYALTSVMMLYAFGANWVQGLYFPEGMELHPDIKGVTASLLTSARLLLAALIVGIAGHFYDGTIYPIAAVLTGVLVVIVVNIVLYERKRTSPATAEAVTHTIEY